MACILSELAHSEAMEYELRAAFVIPRASQLKCVLFYNLYLLLRTYDVLAQQLVERIPRDGRYEIRAE